MNSNLNRERENSKSPNNTYKERNWRLKEKWLQDAFIGCNQETNHSQIREKKTQLMCQNIKPRSSMILESTSTPVAAQKIPDIIPQEKAHSHISKIKNVIAIQHCVKCGHKVQSDKGLK